MVFFTRNPAAKQQEHWFCRFPTTKNTGFVKAKPKKQKHTGKPNNNQKFRALHRGFGFFPQSQKLKPVGQPRNVWCCRVFLVCFCIFGFRHNETRFFCFPTEIKQHKVFGVFTRDPAEKHRTTKKKFRALHKGFGLLFFWFPSSYRMVSLNVSGL